MSTFHYLPNSCELDIRFQAINFQNQEVEKIADKLRKQVRENNQMIIYYSDDEDYVEDVNDEYIAAKGEQETACIPFAIEQIKTVLQNNEMRGIIDDKMAHYEARMYYKYCGKSYELPYCVQDISPLDVSVYNPTDVVMCNGFMRFIKGNDKDSKYRKRIYICIGDTGYNSRINTMCESLNESAGIRMVSISEYEILKDAGIQMGAISVGCNTEYNRKAVEEFRNAIKNGEAYGNLIKMYIDMFLYDTVTSAMFIHCIDTSTMMSVVSIAAGCMDTYCTNGYQENDPANIILIKQYSSDESKDDAQRFIDIINLYCCNIINIRGTGIDGDFYYEGLINDIKDNLYQVPKKQEEKSEDDDRPKTFAEEYPKMDSDTYNIIYSIAADIMEAYDSCGNRKDFFEEVQKALYKRTKTTVSIQ